MDVITIEAQARQTGKGAARAARQQGLVPGIVYGHNVEPVTFQVPELALRPLIHGQDAHRIALKLDGKRFDCIMKDIDFHPVTDRPIHVDFQVLRAGEKITLSVPVHFIGTPIGQTQQGGDTNFIVHELTLTSLPKDIPSAIQVDVTNLSIGESIHLADVNVPNVTFQDPPEKTLVTVLAPRVEEEVEAPVAGEVELEGTEEVDTTESESGE